MVIIARVTLRASPCLFERDQRTALRRTHDDDALNNDHRSGGVPLIITQTRFAPGPVDEGSLRTSAFPVNLLLIFDFLLAIADLRFILGI